MHQAYSVCVAIIDPDEVLGLGTDAIGAAETVAAAGLRAQRIIDDVAADVPGVVAPDVARSFTVIAAELSDQGMIAKTRAEDLLSNERPLSGLAELVGAGYWTPAPRDPEHPLAHEFGTAEQALPEALVERYLPVGAEAGVGEASTGAGDPVETVAPAGRWQALPPTRSDEPPVSGARLGARAGADAGGAGVALIPGVNTTVGAAAGGLAGVAVGMTT